MGYLKQCAVGLAGAALVLATAASAAPVVSAQAGPASPAFADIGGSPDQAAITFMAAIGAVNGVGNGLFDPTDDVTRAEFAKMLVGMLGLDGVASALANQKPSFKDAKHIAGVYWGAVNVGADDGIFVGYPDGDFGPNDKVTYAEAATAIIRAIGDNNQVTNAAVSSDWPGNYVAAAFTLGVNAGVDFVANLPATRGDVAQLMYNAATTVPIYVAENTTPVTYVEYAPLFRGGTTGNAVGGFVAYSGTATAVSGTGVTITYAQPSTAQTNAASAFGPPCPPGGSIAGAAGAASCTVTLPWASTYQLVGVTSAAGLVNGAVTVLYDVADSAVTFAALSSGGASAASTLAASSTAAPSGYYALNNGGATPWIVTNNYDCSQVDTFGADITGATAGSNYAEYVPGTTEPCAYDLLLGGSTPKAVPLSTLGSGFASTSSTSTQYEVNPSPDGSDLGAIVNATYLTAGDGVTYTLNGSGSITVLSETNAGDQVGVVTSTSCASGCDATIAAGATPQMQVSIDGRTYTVNLLSYTTLTLSGKATTLTKTLDGDAAYIAVAAGYGTSSGPSNPGTGDGNAVTIALYQHQVSGTVTAVATDSADVTAANPEGISQITLQPSSGGAATYTTDSSFTGTPQVGQVVTLSLDGSGDAAGIVSGGASQTPVVGIITAAGSSVTASGTTDTVKVQTDLSPSAQTLDIDNPFGAGGAQEPYGLSYVNREIVFSPTYATADFGTSTVTNTAALTPATLQPSEATADGVDGYNGAVLFETCNGYAVADNAGGASCSTDSQPTPMALVTPSTYFSGTANYTGEPASNDCWDIYATSSTNVVLEAYTNCGTSSAAGDTTAATNDNPYLTVVLGDGFNDAGNAVGFTGLTTGHQAIVYSASVGGQTYYVVIDTGDAAN